MDRETARPIAWANLFGGPGTIFSSNFRFGTNILVTNIAKGLHLGPDETLARKPIINIKLKRKPKLDSN